MGAKHCAALDDQQLDMLPTLQVRVRVMVRVRVRGRVRVRVDQVCGVEARVGREVRVLAVGGLEGRACSGRYREIG